MPVGHLAQQHSDALPTLIRTVNLRVHCNFRPTYKTSFKSAKIAFFNAAADREPAKTKRNRPSWKIAKDGTDRIPYIWEIVGETATSIFPNAARDCSFSARSLKTGFIS